MFRLFGQAEAPTAGDSVRKGFMRHGGGAPALRPGSRPEPPTRLLKGGGTAADRLPLTSPGASIRKDQPVKPCPPRTDLAHETRPHPRHPAPALRQLQPRAAGAGRRAAAGHVGPAGHPPPTTRSRRKSPRRPNSVSRRSARSSPKAAWDLATSSASPPSSRKREHFVPYMAVRRPLRVGPAAGLHADHRVGLHAPEFEVEVEVTAARLPA